MEGSRVQTHTEMGGQISGQAFGTHDFLKAESEAGRTGWVWEDSTCLAVFEDGGKGS